MDEPIRRDADWLAERARRTPAAIAVEFEGAALDYRTLDRRVAGLAEGIAGRGVGPGDVVAALFDNGLEMPTLLFALHRLGATLLPLNWRLSTQELLHPIGDAGVDLLLHGAGERAEQARALGAAAGRPVVAPVSPSGEWAAGEAGPIVRSGRRAGEGALALLYTSGTTGAPKGALLGAEAFWSSAMAAAELLGASPADRTLLCMPLFHVGGLSILVRACLAGSTAVVHRRFDAAVVSRVLDTSAITHVSFVANMLGAVLDARGATPAPASLRCVLLGGGPAPVELIERARDRGWPIAPTYGLTEAASQVATRLPEDTAAPLDGRLVPLPGTQLRVLDDSGNALASGQSGEIAVSGPTLMRGYLGRPDATGAAIAGGWLRTGDVGVLDAEGRLRVLDRRDDLIVSGGENVYPAEVEAALVAHPDVAEAGVVGVPDARFGARPFAFWVGVDGSLQEPDLGAHCRERLAAFKVPVAFRRVDVLPRNASGKILRKSLRERARAAAALPGD